MDKYKIYSGLIIASQLKTVKKQDILILRLTEGLHMSCCLLKVLRYQLKAIITQPSFCLKYIWFWFGETFNFFRINKLRFKGREVYLHCTFITLEYKVAGEVLTSLLPSEFGDAGKSFFTWLYVHTCTHTHTLCSHNVFRKWKELMFSVLFYRFLMLGFIWSFSERCVAID